MCKYMPLKLPATHIHTHTPETSNRSNTPSKEGLRKSMPLSTIKGTGWGSHHILTQITSAGPAKPDGRDRCLGTAAVLSSHSCHATHGVFTRQTKSPTLEPSTTHSSGCPDKPSLDWPSCPCPAIWDPFLL